MNKIYLILCICGLILGQNRSTLFYTGPPLSIEEGHEISINQSVADRFIVFNDYVLEAMTFYMSMQSEVANLIVSLRKDSNGIPGELVSKLSTWNYSLEHNNETGYNVIVTTNLCIYLESGESYWLRIDAADLHTQATWAYSNLNTYTYSTSTDQTTWTNSTGDAGAGGVWAEQIYEPPYDPGDVNFDFVVNVVDIVAIVSHIMGINMLSDDATLYADLTNDGQINVVDIVQLVSNILEEQDQNPDFIVEDINPASQYYSQNIGPSFFNDQVSCYYFGKQG